GSLCWLLNNVIVGSPVAVIMELAFSGSILAAWWRHSATRRCGCV
ncbi:MAG: YgjV family protein, partial [Gammaproteobacteria bacterium]|nr:YgjV family protein [Gammaproteobacteria bacterium]